MEFTKVSPCCICGGIPSLEVVYDCDGASRVERYCESRANQVFTRNAVLTKHNLPSEKQKHTYNQNYHLQRIYHEDKKIRILVSRCDLCNEQITRDTRQS